MSIYFILHYDKDLSLPTQGHSVKRSLYGIKPFKRAILYFLKQVL